MATWIHGSRIPQKTSKKTFYCYLSPVTVQSHSFSYIYAFAQQNTDFNFKYRCSVQKKGSTNEPDLLFDAWDLLAAVRIFFPRHTHRLLFIIHLFRFFRHSTKMRISNNKIFPSSQQTSCRFVILRIKYTFFHIIARILFYQRFELIRSFHRTAAEHHYQNWFPCDFAAAIKMRYGGIPIIIEISFISFIWIFDFSFD